MLRRRFGKRDTSICIFCHHRLSLQPSGRPQHRLFSVAPRCASDHDPGSIPSSRPVPIDSLGAGFPSPRAHTVLTTRAGQQLWQPHGASQSGAPPRPPLGTGPPTLPERPKLAVGGITHVFRKPPSNDILDPHVAKARERLIAQKEAQQAPQTPQFQHPGTDPRVRARYVWDPERQQAIEKYLKAESTNLHGDASGLKQRTATLPDLPPPSNGIGSSSPIISRVPIGSRSPINFSPPIRSSSATRSSSPVESPTGSNFPIRSGSRTGVSGHEENKFGSFRSGVIQYSSPPRQPSARPIPRSRTPHDRSQLSQPSSSHQQSNPGQDSTPSGLSRLTSSEVLGRISNHSPQATTPRPQDTTKVDQTIVGSSFFRLGVSDVHSVSEKDTAKAEDAVTSSSGSETLAVAGAYSAKIKSDIRKTSVGRAGMSQEWAHLARKQTNRPNLEDGFWDNLRRTAFQSQENHVAPPDTKAAEPDPRESNKIDPTVDKSTNHFTPQVSDISSTAIPARNESYDRESKKQKESLDRNRKSDKQRGGKRSGGGSRFLEDDDAGEVYDRHAEKRRQKESRKAQREAERTGPIPIILPELIGITAFANALKIPPKEFLVQLGELGFEGVTLDSLMAGETAALVAQEYGYEPTVETGDSQDLKPRPPPEDPSVLPPRPPVVTIMGHVDHGKTTILDYLRKSSVVAQEHGGITQHIGAFSVKLSSGKPITFLDTPGHAAFLTMRQRGANVTDIVVLVVAADDSVKPQTLEALKHARASRVPIIVAINKIDKDGARINAVKNDLAAAGVEIEDHGGDVQVVCVSGKTGQGMDDLEENILTLSEILDHRAELDGPAEGWVLESSLKQTGKVATVLVKRGTLRPGDYIAAGLTWAKIRQLRNEAGVDVAEAPPGTPVEILGWKDLPAAGDQVIQSPDEDKAKRATAYREGLRERERDATEYEAIAESRKALQEKRARDKAAGEEGTTFTGTGVQEHLPDEENGTKLVNFVVKGDVHGSVEAVCAAIQEIGNHEVRPRILRSATGAISEFDVEHAATSKSVLVNFATTTPGHIRRMAEEQGVRIIEHTVIYHLVDDVTANLSGHLAPSITTRVLGDAEILQIFPINLRGRVYKNIAGCRVRNGVVAKNSLYRVLRKGKTIFEGKLETLKQARKDVTEMRKGTECGMGFEDFQDLEIGDQIQAYEEVRTARAL